VPGVEVERVSDAVWRVGTPTVGLTSVLVRGEQRALVVDTGGGPRQGRQVQRAVRELTALPLVVVNTHDHWDHWFANAVLLDEPGSAAEQRQAWGPPAVAWEARAREQWSEALGHEPELRPDVLRPPTGTLEDGAVLDLGGLRVEVRVLGGHTAYDLALVAGEVALPGDLVEESGPPQLDRTSSLDRWVESLDVLLATGTRTFVSGHGRPVDRAFVVDQQRWLAAQRSGGGAGVGASAGPG